jgi:hypothetical protein
VSARPAGACLAWLVPERNGATSMPKRTRKRTRVVIGGVDTHGRTTTPPSSISGDGCWATKSSLLTVAATGCCLAG